MELTVPAAQACNWPYPGSGILLVGLLLAPMALSRWVGTVSQAVAASRNDALEAAKLMKDWGVWLAGIQTAAIAAVVTVLTKFDPRAEIKLSIFAAITFFCASIIADTALLAGLPSVVLRLDGQRTTKLNDIYEMRLFRFSPVRVATAYVLSHWYFIFGIVSFWVAFLLL